MKYYIIPVGLGFFDTHGFRNYYLNSKDKILENWRENGDKKFELFDSNLSMCFDKDIGEWFVFINSLEELHDLLYGSPHGSFEIALPGGRVTERSFKHMEIYVGHVFGIEDHSLSSKR